MNDHPITTDAPAADLGSSFGGPLGVISQACLTNAGTPPATLPQADNTPKVPVARGTKRPRAATQTIIDETDGSPTTKRVKKQRAPKQQVPVGQGQSQRKRNYVNSVQFAGDVRFSVIISCSRLKTGGFKCTFALEKRAMPQTNKPLRANAKGGPIIERRYDSFLVSPSLIMPDGSRIEGPRDANGEEPFPTYEQMQQNFLSRGLDFRKYVREDLALSAMAMTAAAASAAAASSSSSPSSSTETTPSPDSVQAALL